MEQALRDRLARGLVTVHADGEGHRMGFVVGEKVLTAAHCIPAVPPETNLWYGDYHTVEVSGVGESEKIMLFLECHDPCHDIAILSASTSTGGDHPDPESAMEFLFARQGISVRLGEQTVDEPLALHICTHEGRWVSGNTRISYAGQTGLMLDVSPDAILGGTSGAPAFNDQGEAFALVSISGADRTHEVMLPRLAAVLPGYVLMEFDSHWADYVRGQVSGASEEEAETGQR